MRRYDLIVIGGGSAGLAAATAAYEAGIRDILLLERDFELGGILMQCIHNGFGLHTFKEELSGPAYAERYIAKMEEYGIEYKTGTMVTELAPDKTVGYVNPDEGYVRISGKAIILAMGCRERTRGSIVMPGYRPCGIWTAGTAQRYINMEGYMVGRKVFILGSGDIGLIMARRLTLEGAQVLGVAELMPYSNGLARNRKQCLEDYGIPLYLSHTVTDIFGKSRLAGIEISEVDGNLKPVPGTGRKIECDTLLLSVGLIPENELSTGAGVELSPRTKGATVSESYETSIPGIFACGNVLHVHDLVDFVSEEGAKAGTAAAAYIRGDLFRGRSFASKAGTGIGYVLPQSVNAEACADRTEFMFRVTGTFRKAEVRIYKDGELWKTVKRPHMAPAEMEKITLRKEDLTDIRESLLFEVAAGEIAGEAVPPVSEAAEPLSHEPSDAMEMICIVCPTGCRLKVRKDAEGKVVSVTGNTCPRGEKYARQEVESPTRMLTGTVRIEGGCLPVLPVITSDPVPKDRIFDVMREINRVTAHAPVHTGDILLENVLGLGVNITASRSMPEESENVTASRSMPEAGGNVTASRSMPEAGGNGKC